MTQRASVLFKTGWISLTVIGVAILVFGLIVTTVPTSSDPSSLRAIGVASIGMGLFGLLITTIAYRRRERWAWFASWYYPLFWTWHLVGGLPLGEALRRELRGSGVRVCQVLPTGVNTAGFLHTRTRGFRFPKQITWLLQDPETVARAVVRCLERRWVRNIPLGVQGKATIAIGALAPRLLDALSGYIVRLVKREGHVESPVDNLFEAPFRGHDLRGWGKRSDDDPTPHPD